MGLAFTQTGAYKPHPFLIFLENWGTELQLQKVCTRGIWKGTYPSENLHVEKCWYGFLVNTLLQLLFALVCWASNPDRCSTPWSRRDLSHRSPVLPPPQQIPVYALLHNPISYALAFSSHSRVRSDVYRFVWVESATVTVSVVLVLLGFRYK